MNAISVKAGVDTKTVQSWIGILESSFVVYLLRPHFNSFNKTIVKRPKLYFYDTGVVCSLLNIREHNQLENYPLRGAIFETMVISEMVKKRTNMGLPVDLYYWRDKTGHEIDLLIDNAWVLLPIEIKSGKTIQSEFFKNLIYFKNLSKGKSAYVFYAGDMQQNRTDGTIISNWRNLTSLNI